MADAYTDHTYMPDGFTVLAITFEGGTHRVLAWDDTIEDSSITCLHTGPYPRCKTYINNFLIAQKQALSE